MANGIHFEVDGAIARITLDRPEVGNALDIPMARELLDCATRCESDPAIRCAVITGRGKLFCAGGDVLEFSRAGDRLPEFLAEITAPLHAALSILARMNKPLVTAINGAAAGAGIGLAIIGDVVLAEPTAMFTLAYTGIGMTPDGGSTWLLTRLVGLRRAQELCLTNRRLTAAEAAGMGLITRAVEVGTLAAEANAVAVQLASGATLALGATRRLLADSYTSTFETQMEQESRTIAAQASVPDGREGIAAFVAKRKPHFTGKA
jgi:2-(1,2-epoxy-1,2-dihydrophenyl)acetyl-CoA isomerase